MSGVCNVDIGTEIMVYKRVRCTCSTPAHTCEEYSINHFAYSTSASRVLQLDLCIVDNSCAAAVHSNMYLQSNRLHLV